MAASLRPWRRGLICLFGVPREWRTLLTWINLGDVRSEGCLLLLLLQLFRPSFLKISFFGDQRKKEKTMLLGCGVVVDDLIVCRRLLPLVLVLKQYTSSSEILLLTIVIWDESDKILGRRKKKTNKQTRGPIATGPKRHWTVSDSPR